MESTRTLRCACPASAFDAETGLHYNYFRYYAPETARYPAPDPLGLTAGPNPSAYVANPHAWADPLGLTPCEEAKAGRSRGEAKAQALRDAGIPEGAEPIEVNEYVPATTPEWQVGRQLPDDNHQPIYYTEEAYEHPNGEDVVVYQDHWFGHHRPGGAGPSALACPCASL